MFVHVLVSAAGKYREFHQLYSDRKFRAAGELLVSLLHSNIVPRRLASCACRHTILPSNLYTSCSLWQVLADPPD